MASHAKTLLVSILLLSTSIRAWPLDFTSAPKNFSILTTRDEVERAEGTRRSCGTGCKACVLDSGCSQNKERSLTQRDLIWPADGVDKGVHPQSDIWINGTHEFHLEKRVLETLTPNDIAGHVDELSDNEDTIPLTPKVDGKDVSYTVLERFSDYPRGTAKKLIIGTGGVYLTGCTMITVVSNRAVYMGHLWQNLGFLLVDPQPEDIGPNFEQNVINLIRGQTPLYHASGPALDPSLFTDNGGGPAYAALMVPRHDNQGKTAYFINKNKQIADLIRELIPGCRVDVIKYHAQVKDESRGQTYAPGEATAVFEYDADADGQGHGDWRLFYETNMMRGRAPPINQLVIP